jgi:hypothetical protein
VLIAEREAGLDAGDVDVDLALGVVGLRVVELEVAIEARGRARELFERRIRYELDLDPPP